jgi:hypothetical protein
MPLGSFNLNALAKLLSSGAYNYQPFGLKRITENPTYSGTNQISSWGAFVDMNSTYYAVSAHNDRTATVGGRVDIFNISDGSLFRTITNPNTQTADVIDSFGWKFAMNSTYIAIGASTENSATTADVGIIYLYRISDGSLIRTYSSTGTQAASEFFGRYIDLSENYLIAGVPTRSTSSGAVFVYNFSSSTPVYAITNPNTGGLNTSDTFGTGVAINNNYFYVGAPTEDFNNTTANYGAVHQYQLSDGTRIATIYNPNIQATVVTDDFGSDRMICNNRYLVIPAYLEDVNTGNSGTVYVYDATTTLTDTRLATLQSPNIYNPGLSDNFGLSVAISNNHLVVHAQEKQFIAYATEGHFYVYKTIDWSLDRFYEVPQAGGRSDFTVSNLVSKKTAINDDYMLLAGNNNNGDQSFVELYDKNASGWLTQAEGFDCLVNTSSTSNSSTITISSGIQDGDIGILIDHSSVSTLTNIPADWTQVPSAQINTTISLRASMKRLKSSDANTTITGFSSGTLNKVLLIFRGTNNTVIQGFNITTATNGVGTPPAAQALSPANSKNPSIGIGIFASTTSQGITQPTITNTAGNSCNASSNVNFNMPSSTNPTLRVKIFGCSSSQSSDSPIDSGGKRDNFNISMPGFTAGMISFVMELTKIDPQVRTSRRLYTPVLNNVKTDNSPSVTQYGANIVTSNSKFGGSSLSTRWVSAGSADNSRPIRTTEQFFSLGTGAYTIEWWAYLASNPTNAPGWFDTAASSTNWQRTPLLQYTSSSNIRMIGGGATSAGVTLLDFPSSAGWPSTGAWHHWAIVRESTSTNGLKLYVDGVLKVTSTDSSDYSSYPWALCIGGLTPTTGIDPSGNQTISANFNEFRISNVARYTSAFTPATSQFVNDPNTKCLYHLNGTNGSYVFLDDATTY